MLTFIIIVIIIFAIIIISIIIIIFIIFVIIIMFAIFYSACVTNQSIRLFSNLPYLLWKFNQHGFLPFSLLPMQQYHFPVSYMKSFYLIFFYSDPLLVNVQRITSLDLRTFSFHLLLFLTTFLDAWSPLPILGICDLLSFITFSYSIIVVLLLLLLLLLFLQILCSFRIPFSNWMVESISAFDTKMSSLLSKSLYMILLIYFQETRVHPKTPMMFYKNFHFLRSNQRSRSIYLLELFQDYHCAKRDIIQWRRALNIKFLRWFFWLYSLNLNYHFTSCNPLNS